MESRPSMPSTTTPARVRGAAALLALVLALPALAPSPARAQELTLDRIYGKPPLVERLPAGIRWTGDSKGVSYLTDVKVEGVEHRALVVRSVPSGKQRVVCLTDTVAVPADLRFSDTDVFQIGGAHHGADGDYTWSPDGKRVLFAFRGDLFLLDAKSARIRRLTRTKGHETDAVFSPDGKRVAFTRGHNLYTLDVDGGSEVQLTTTGCDSVLNGTLDWVYMEELFTRGEKRAFWWAPDGKRLAFMEFQEHPVPEFPLVNYMPIHATTRLERYPKAGDPGPAVRVGVVEAGGGDVTWMDVDTSDDSYIARTYWLGDSRGVAIEKLNRAQDHLTLFAANARTGEADVVMEESSKTWINVTYLHHYYRNARRFLWGSERDGHSHLYLYNLDGSLVRQLTSGDWEVTDLAGVDESKHRIYFIANEKDVRERHLYRVDERGEKPRRITREDGSHDVTLSPNDHYYIDRFSTITRPTLVTVHAIDGKPLFTIGDRQSAELAAMKRPKPEFLTIDHGGRTYYAMITKPLDLDPARRYPVIVFVYGGPGAQVVRDAWSRQNLWHSLMAERGYIVFSIDGRGSYGRGTAWENWLLEDFGRYELEDQLVGVSYLRTLPYVDPDRIGIWGWSYGGTMTLTALFKAADVFKVGAAVAPVTDWHLYDSIYTERYMKLPRDHEAAYEKSSPLSFAGELRGHLLLMHGDADDNVHFQNTVKLVDKLIDAGRDFDLMIYPRKKHGITGTKDRRFLYAKMMRFFDRYLRDATPSGGEHE